MSERETAVVRLTNAERYPHARSDRYAEEWQTCRGKEIRVHLPAEPNDGGMCDGDSPLWRVVDADLAKLSPRLPADLAAMRSRFPGVDVRFCVCRHQLQEPPD